jgi:hypothetical protein
LVLQMGPEPVMDERINVLPPSMSTVETQD